MNRNLFKVQCRPDDYIFTFILINTSIVIISVSAADPRLIIYPGDINFGILLNVHKNGNESDCGVQLDPRSIHNGMAAVWATHQINSRKESLSNLNLGIYLYDTCSMSNFAERQTVRLIAHLDDIQAKVCRNNKEPPLFVFV
ncbi:hypothetical protein B4U80_10137 [Leptotrombidium deliense]|uniref:Metabotropic glutamate receptor 8-like protein n=1 Tax=Leptotrombidium deliense TaxID=299467 RepID=A0A443SLU8_9ACAR|nr:hypothetical protein B4U80_10137 [Leptotrombidium deliense]